MARLVALSGPGGLRPIRQLLAACALALAAGCTPAPTTSSTPPTAPNDAASAGVAGRASPERAIAATPPPPIAAATIVIPPGAIYVCVAEANGERRTTAIDFAPKVGELCAKNPEMGPCQYERNVCRRGGGRVYAADGVEVTMATEAEYDRKVMRVRLKSN